MEHTTLDSTSGMDPSTLEPTNNMDYITLNPKCSKNNINLDPTSSLDLNSSDPTSLSSTSKNKTRQFNSLKFEDNVLLPANRDQEETFANSEDTESEDPGEDFSHLTPEEQVVLNQISKIIRGTFSRC